MKELSRRLLDSVFVRDRQGGITPFVRLLIQIDRYNSPIIRWEVLSFSDVGFLFGIQEEELKTLTKIHAADKPIWWTSMGKDVYPEQFYNWMMRGISQSIAYEDLCEANDVVAYFSQIEYKQGNVIRVNLNSTIVEDFDRWVAVYPQKVSTLLSDPTVEYAIPTIDFGPKKLTKPHFKPDDVVNITMFGKYLAYDPAEAAQFNRLSWENKKALASKMSYSTADKLVKKLREELKNDGYRNCGFRICKASCGSRNTSHVVQIISGSYSGQYVVKRTKKSTLVSPDFQCANRYKSKTRAMDIADSLTECVPPIMAHVLEIDEDGNTVLGVED